MTHMFIHVPSKREVCLLCGMKFKRKADVAKHCIRRHNVSVREVQDYPLPRIKLPLQEEEFFKARKIWIPCLNVQ